MGQGRCLRRGGDRGPDLWNRIKNKGGLDLGGWRPGGERPVNARARQAVKDTAEAALTAAKERRG